jgi:hypothetical protein
MRTARWRRIRLLPKFRGQSNFKWLRLTNRYRCGHGSVASGSRLGHDLEHLDSTKRNPLITMPRRAIRAWARQRMGVMMPLCLSAGLRDTR